MTLVREQLNGCQLAAVQAIKAWFDERPDDVREDDIVWHPQSKELSLGGLAGTGKTSLVAFLMQDSEFLGLFAGVLTPTGKAAEVLRSKGIPADTIHSALYRCTGEEEENDRGELSPVFETKTPIFRRGDFVIIDEASMVNAELARDIRNAGWNVLWVGDHGQLPPVGEDPGIMTEPDLLLDEIMRQAAENPLIACAYHLRQGGTPQNWGPTYSEVVVRARTYPSHYAKAAYDGRYDQIICGFNRDRHAINIQSRALRGFTDPLCVGDLVICLRNSRKKGIWNGQIFEVLELSEGSVTNCVSAVLRSEDPDAGAIYVDIDVPSLGGAPAGYGRAKKAHLFDYAYAITCHKAQGSEWGKVLVVDSPCQSWDNDRWRYTAVTRARDQVTIFA